MRFPTLLVCCFTSSLWPGVAVALAPSESDDAPALNVVVDDELPRLTIIQPDAGHIAPIELRPRRLRTEHDAGQDTGDCASPDLNDAAVADAGGADAGMSDAGQHARRRPRVPVEAARGPKPDAGERVTQEMIKALSAGDHGDDAGCVASPPASPLVVLAVGWALSRRRRIG